ncbi:hypothetical protein KLEB273_gp084 [Bacillus phage vB_BauM_KLEB27-3]|nr:hypothetical protein KLEB273_gp084 [Bacillus phage vB_BauM_KLEB27-3]
MDSKKEVRNIMSKEEYLKKKEAYDKEVEQIKKQDEEFVNKLLKGYQKKSIAQTPSTVVEEEEDDEEVETFVIDPDKNLVMQKEDAETVGKSTNPMIFELGPEVEEIFKNLTRQVLKEEEEKEKENILKDTVDRALVGRAVSKLLAELREERDIVCSLLSESNSYPLQVVNTIEEEMDKKITDLRKCHTANGVDTDKIPGWARGNVNSYIYNTMNAICDLLDD